MKLGTLVQVAPLLEEALKNFFEELGVPQAEWEDRGLDIANTPRRVARMYRDELLSSYKEKALESLIKRFTCFDAVEDDAMVGLGPIEFTSLCAHHVLPFTGEAWVGYIPNEKLIGASKIPRVVEHYSRMLQIQERMARQVADFIIEHAGASAVLVLIKAKHMCMQCRGIKKSVNMVTTAIRPISTYTERRDIINEFYQQIAISKGINNG